MQCTNQEVSHAFRMHRYSGSEWLRFAGRNALETSSSQGTVRTPQPRIHVDGNTLIGKGRASLPINATGATLAVVAVLAVPHWRCAFQAVRTQWLRLEC